jgi:hypothetical protein
LRGIAAAGWQTRQPGAVAHKARSRQRTVCQPYPIDETACVAHDVRSNSERASFGVNNDRSRTLARAYFQRIARGEGDVGGSLFAFQEEVVRAARV